METNVIDLSGTPTRSPMFDFSWRRPVLYYPETKTVAIGNPGMVHDELQSHLDDNLNFVEKHPGYVSLGEGGLRSAPPAGLGWYGNSGGHGHDWYRYAPNQNPPWHDEVVKALTPYEPAVAQGNDMTRGNLYGDINLEGIWDDDEGEYSQHPEDPPYILGKTAVELPRVIEEGKLGGSQRYQNYMWRRPIVYHPDKNVVFLGQPGQVHADISYDYPGNNSIDGYVSLGPEAAHPESNRPAPPKGMGWYDTGYMNRLPVKPGELPPFHDAVVQALAPYEPAAAEPPITEGMEGLNPWVLGRTANILDPIHDTLDPRVWDNSGSPRPRLKAHHKRWIQREVYDLAAKFHPDPQSWLNLVLTGSLTTYQYSDKSDCDISLFVNPHVLPEWSRGQLIGLMVKHMDGTRLPGTPFELQCFVVAKNISADDLYQPGLRSGYDIDKGIWLVPPEHREHDVQREYNSDYVYALESADKMERLLRYDPQRAVDYWHQIHKRRMRDQTEGKGDYSQANIVYKFLANRGLFPEISQASGEYIARIARPADPEWWEDRNQGKPLYHATDSDRLPHILQHGLQPWDSETNMGGAQYGNEYEIDPESDWLRPRPGHVYLTENLGRAEQYSRNHYNPTLLRIDPSHLRPELINPDEDSSNTATHGWEQTNPQWADQYLSEAEGEGSDYEGLPEFKSLGDVAEQIGYGDDPERQTHPGIATTKTLAYRGVIPPEAITPLRRHPQLGTWLEEDDPMWHHRSP